MKEARLKAKEGEQLAASSCCDLSALTGAEWSKHASPVSPRPVSMETLFSHPNTYTVRSSDSLCYPSSQPKDQMGCMNEQTTYVFCMHLRRSSICLSAVHAAGWRKLGCSSYLSTSPRSEPQFTQLSCSSTIWPSF